ncbi:TolC family protein [Bacteroidota bacterium]
MPLKRIIILFTYIISNLSLNAQEIDLTFNELESFLTNNSPQVKILENDYELNAIEKQIGLQWSNPEFNFELEDIKNDFQNEREIALTLNKRFEFPWVYSKRTEYWEARLQAAEFLKRERYNSFLTEMKSGYAELKLLENQHSRVNKIKSILESISQTAMNQYEEGTISGLDQNLIYMSLFNVETAIIRLREQMLSLESEWKSLAGIESEEGVNLKTTIIFKKIDWGLLDEAVKNPQKYLSIQSGLHKEKSLQYHVELENSNLFPDFGIGGGYKNVTPNLNGFVFEFSLPLPLLNQNKPQLQKRQIEFDSFKKNFKQFRNHILRKVSVLSNTIKANEYAIEKLYKNEMNGIEQLEQIISSYKEGWISLNELLNSIEIYFEFIQTSNEQLINYYRSAFKLEAIIGKSLVSF